MASRIRHVLYLAAHGGFAGQPVPLGGGAAVAHLLEAEWARTRPFDLEILGPSLLGSAAPTAQQLVRFNERQYAAFCARFHQATTREALRHDPRHTAILVNDLAEGPDFARLAHAGFYIVTLYHVEVVAYIASIYLRNRISAPALARLWERLRPVASPPPSPPEFSASSSNSSAPACSIPPASSCPLHRCARSSAKATRLQPGARSKS